MITKVLKKNTDGVSGRYKLLWQFLSAIIFMYFLVSSGQFDTNSTYLSIKRWSSIYLLVRSLCFCYCWL